MQIHKSILRTVTSLSVTLLSACATVKTLNPSNGHVQIEHQGAKSYCEEIPRVYSGFSYNLCKLYGEPNQQGNWGSSLGHVPFVVIDTVCSAAADTLALPYTLVRQANDGTIQVN